MGANFMPDLKGYSGQGAFRFWCQHVLPIVYDDSLSYMELLNKVVKYLNNVIEDISVVEDNVGVIATAFGQLQEYVNNYFDDLDLTHEVEEQLDKMAANGTLSLIIKPLVDAETSHISEYVTQWLNENVDPVGSAVIVDDSLTVQGAAADALVVGRNLFNMDNAIEEAEIEGYEKVMQTVIGTITENKVYLSPALQTNLNGWSYGVFDVLPNVEYLITGTGSTQVRLFVVVDSNNELIYTYDNIGETRYLENVRYITPSNAAKIMVNLRKTDGSMSVVKALSLNFVKASIDENIKEVEIEGYYRNYKELQADSVTDGYAYLSPTTQTALSGWCYGVYEIEEFHKYIISGTASTQVRLFVVVDVDGNWMYSCPSTGRTEYIEDYVYETPKKAKYIVVNLRKSDGQMRVKNGNFLTFTEYGDILKVNGDNYVAGRGELKNNFVLNKSYNGSFSFTSISDNNGVFKGCGDDICPINVPHHGYVGANHGWNTIYECNSTNHGLTVGDIGKTYVANGETWVIMKINNSNVFTIGKISGNWEGVSRSGNVPSSIVIGGRSISISSNELKQFYPSIKNIQSEVINKTDDVVVVSEQYDIVGLKGGIDYITSHIGTCDNDSVINNSYSGVRISNVYVFDNQGGCKLSQSIVALIEGISLAFYGGVQSGGFSNSDRFAIPNTIYKNLGTASDYTYVPLETWDDANNPPNVFIQVDGANGEKGFALMIDTDDRLELLIDRNAGMFNGKTKKMYPHALSFNSLMPVNEVYAFNSYRVPLKKVDGTNTYVGYCRNGHKWRAIVFSNVGETVNISVPTVIQGGSVEIVEGNLQINNVITDKLYVSSSNGGYAVLDVTI